MSPEALKATMIAKALHQMANASANLQIVAAQLNNSDASRKGFDVHELQDTARLWQYRYDDAEKLLDQLLEPIPES